MSKPAVLASRAISMPRVRRIVIEATTSLRASFSLTTLRTTSFARTELTPAFTFALFRIGQFDRQHHIAQALAVNVLRQRNRDAAAERILDHEIERLEIAQWVAPDRPFGDVLEGLRHAFRREFALKKFPVLGVVADHRNIRGVAFVAGARVRKIVDADAHSAPSTTTWALTRFFGSSTDFTASTSRTRGSQAPPAPPGPCMCMARTSKPIACAALRSRVRPATRSRTS